MTDETRDARLRRLGLRSIRRGIKEMDLVLGDFAARHLAGMGDADLDAYEALLAETDLDLLGWVTGAEPPAPHAPLIARLRESAAAMGQRVRAASG